MFGSPLCMFSRQDGGGLQREKRFAGSVRAVGHPKTPGYTFHMSEWTDGSISQFALSASALTAIMLGGREPTSSKTACPLRM
jgi:hypothetical protein